MVRGALDFGMSPMESRRNMETPGMMKVGAERIILDMEVYRTATSAHFLDIPISSPFSSWILMPLLISPMRMQ